MPQFDPMPQSVGNAAGTSAPMDDNLTQQMHTVVSEAAERVTFHRIETERWTRVGRAAQSALQQLGMSDPVAKQAPDDFLPGVSDQPMQSPSF